MLVWCPFSTRVITVESEERTRRWGGNNIIMCIASFLFVKLYSLLQLLPIFHFGIYSILNRFCPWFFSCFVHRHRVFCFISLLFDNLCKGSLLIHGCLFLKLPLPFTMYFCVCLFKPCIKVKNKWSEIFMLHGWNWGWGA